MLGAISEGIKGVIIGLVLICVAFFILGYNEGRYVKVCHGPF